MPAPAILAIPEAHHYAHHAPKSVPSLPSLSNPSLHALQESSSSDVVHRLGEHADAAHPARLVSFPLGSSAPLSAAAQKALRNYTPPPSAPLPPTPALAAAPAASSSSPPSTSAGALRSANLSKQLAYLRWRRSAVESSIRGLVDGRRRAEEAVAVATISGAAGRGEGGGGGAKSQWTAAVVLDELSKPLELSRTFIEDFEEADKRTRAREEITVERHLKSVGDIKKKLREREKKERRTGKVGKTTATPDDLKERVDSIEQILREKKTMSRELAKFQV